MMKMQRHLSLGNILISLRETLNVLLNGTMVTQELNIGTINLDTTFLAKTDVFLTTQGSETPVLGDDDLLATGELVHGAAEGLDGEVTVGVTGADREQDLADVHTGDGAVGLTEGTAHTGLETIGSSAGQHLVDTDDVEGVGADTEVETFLSSGLDEVPIPLLIIHSITISMGGGYTCWRKYGRLREPRRTTARTRWRPCARR
jgi:hypothetical protein